MLVPSLAGLLAFGSPALPAFLLLAGVLQAFFLRAALEEWRASRPRQSKHLAWALAFGVGFHGTAIFAIAHWDLHLLLALGAGIAIGPLAVRQSLWLRVKRRDAGEALVVLSLSLLAPAMAYASAGRFDTWSRFLWLPVALYLWSSITVVRLSLAPVSSARRRAHRRAAAAYHIAMALAVGAAVAASVVPAAAAAAFVPGLVRAATVVARDRRVGSVTRLGMSEALFAGVFTTLLVLAYRLS